eukprot:scaffold5502_cov168-Ochromonas_danica.AAC.1
MTAFPATCIVLIALLLTLNSAASHHGFNANHYVEELYQRFRKDLVGLHALMDEWTNLNKKPLVKICHAHMSVQETELLYMRVRTAKPRLVFELGPACGWSSQAILLALEHNKQGELYSYDMERKAPRVIGALSKGEVLSKRWVFTKGLVQNTYQAKTWDFCVKNAASISMIVEEIACLEEMTRKVVSEDAGVMTTTSMRNVMYGADAVSGEGSMSVLAIRESLKIGNGLKTTPNLYNPSIFFHV